MWRWVGSSEISTGLEAVHGFIISTKGLVDILWIGCISSESLFGGAKFSLGEDLSTGSLISPQHLDGIDVIDLNEMGRQPIVEEAWWENHVISSVPELWLILGIESQHVLRSNEPEGRNDIQSGKHVGEHGRVVHGTSGHSQQS